MRNLKLVLEYDGSSFYGFQRQTGHVTVQSTLEAALSKLFNQTLKIGAASGRTDSGVHAECQIVHFFVESKLDPERILKGLNHYLPRTIAVKEVQDVPGKFHARFQAKEKIYEYQVWNHPVRSPLHTARSYHVSYALDLKKMKAGARVLKGKHDFRAFCASSRAAVKSAKEKSTIRTIHRFSVEKKGSLILFRVGADGFLYHMVRNLVGTLLEIGQGKLAVKDLNRILNSRDRRFAGKTVPAHGLTLIHVTY